MKRPIENCYWVVPGKLLAGEYPRNKDKKSSMPKINALLDVGVEVFIDLTHKDDKLKPYWKLLQGDAEHLPYPIVDNMIPPSDLFTSTLLSVIDLHLRQDKIAYVHCWGGVGRTGTIIGCWLARYGSKNPIGDLDQLWRECPKSNQRPSPETIEQRNYVINWRAGQ